MRNRNNFRNKSRNNTRPLETCVAVHAEECNGDAEKMVRRFTKKVKREGIIEEQRDRRYFSKPSVKATEKKREKKKSTSITVILSYQPFSTADSTHRWKSILILFPLPKTKVHFSWNDAVSHEQKAPFTKLFLLSIFVLKIFE